jgi:DNA processing protein
MHISEKIFLHALRSLPHMGDKTLRKILASFEDSQAAWESQGLPEGLTLGPRMKGVFLARHTTIPNPQEYFAELEKEDIVLVTEDEEAYPWPLLEIPDAPFLLYIRGNYDFGGKAPLLAVVGSRKLSGYGKEATEKLVAPLAQAGVTIVSGLAFGIDKVAHETALRAGGKTIAVLGSGIHAEGITPTSHKRLGLDITQSGALISEFPPATIPGPGNFPLRNRIIAGLCVGTIVIEAAEKSGSLITARLALDYNREVFAVPGSIFSSASSGTNGLLKQGAQLITSSKDILEALLLTGASSNETSPLLASLSPAEQKIVALLKQESFHINALAKHSRLPVNEVSSLLLMLELKSVVKHIGNQTYIAF